MSKVHEGLRPEDYGEYEKIAVNPDDPKPFDEVAENIRRYWEDLRVVVAYCGKVAYFWGTLKGLNNGNPDVKDLAASRSRDREYYRGNVDHWVAKSRRALQIFKLSANEFGGFNYRDKDFLNGLISEDRRRSYYDTIAFGKKKGIVFTPKEIEERYQARVKKRAAKKLKNHQ